MFLVDVLLQRGQSIASVKLMEDFRTCISIRFGSVSFQLASSVLSLAVLVAVIDSRVECCLIAEEINLHCFQDSSDC